MSKNISKLSGRKGLKENLFKRMINTASKSKNDKEIKQLAEEYHVGMSTIHGAESFYEFLRPEHKEKKAWICNGSACMCAGTQGKVRKKLSEKLGEDKIGMMFCLGHCFKNSLFDTKNQFIACSGRLSFELVQKTLMANIGLLMGVGAPTSLAIDLAKRFDMTLIGFVKSDSFNIYCGENRILE